MNDERTKASLLLSIERATEGLTRPTLAALLEAAGSSDLAERISALAEKQVRADLSNQLAALDVVQLAAIDKELEVQKPDTASTSPEIDDLQQQLDSLRSAVRERPVIGEVRPGHGWYERLPEDIPEALRVSAVMVKARAELREIGDELKATIEEASDIRTVERGVVMEMVLPGIDVIVDALNLTERAVGTWTTQRGLIAQGLTWLELAKRVFVYATGMDAVIGLIERALAACQPLLS